MLYLSIDSSFESNVSLLPSCVDWDTPQVNQVFISELWFVKECPSSNGLICCTVRTPPTPSILTCTCGGTSYPIYLHSTCNTIYTASQQALALLEVISSGNAISNSSNIKNQVLQILYNVVIPTPTITTSITERLCLVAYFENC